MKILEAEVKKWRDFALELAKEHDSMREQALVQKNKDKTIIEACKEQILKLKKLAQVKADFIIDEKILRDELVKEKEERTRLE